MVSKNPRIWAKVILLTIVFIGVFFIFLFLFRDSGDNEDDRRSHIISIAAVAIDQNVPGSDYDMVNALVLENPDNTAVVHMDGFINSSPCKFSVMMESAKPDDVKSYSVYYVAAGDSIFFYEKTESTARPPEVDSIKQSIDDYLVKNYGDFAVYRLQIQGEKLEVTISLSDVNTDSAPENWNNIRESILAMYNSLFSEFSSDSLKHFVIYADDSSGNHLITAANGKISYDAFEVTLASGANPPTISLAEFNAISAGMTYQEVTDIIGSSGEVTSEVDIFDDYEYFTQVRTWEGDGRIGANAVIEFQGGKVISKAQYGLE